MKGKVEIEVIAGGNVGEKYEYTAQERVFIGRQDDCAIIFPEKTVSRYHCMLDIRPPRVVLQDFGSLNGTFLNGEKIGQRERDQSWEEARGLEHEEFELNDGDELGLGKVCKLRVRKTQWETCALCGRELAPAVEGDATVSEDDVGEVPLYDNFGRRICADCYAENRRKAEELAKQKALAEELARQQAEAERLEKLRQEEEARQEREAEEKRRREEEERKKKEQERKKREAERKKKEEELRRREAEAARLKKEQEQAALAAERERLAKEAEQKRLEEERKQREAEQKRLEEEKKQREAEQKRLAEEKKRKEEAERLKKAQALMAEMEAQLNADTRSCAVCGKPFKPTAPDNTICPACMEKQAKELLGEMLDALMGKPQPGGKPGTPSLLPGYEKVSLLGKGGMGEVWKVKETKTGKLYALKTMLPEVAADEHSKQMFLREADISMHLKHKNVVRAYKTGCVNNTFYILMDLCEGGSVDSLMEKKGGKLPLPLATYIILQVLSGLDFVHNMDLEVEIRAGLFKGTREVSTTGVVHRDFKPGNIFLADKTDHPVAMVADFGMAKAFALAGMSRVTRSGTVMGTPVFMPKQQVKNCKYAKPEVDVWAAAASYYNMLTGQLVKNFRRGKNPMMVIVSEEPVPIRQRDPSIPAKMAAVIDKALQEDPTIGYSSAAAFRRDLINALPPEVYSYCKGVIK